MIELTITVKAANFAILRAFERGFMYAWKRKKSKQMLVVVRSQVFHRWKKARRKKSLLSSIVVTQSAQLQPSCVTQVQPYVFPRFFL